MQNNLKFLFLALIILAVTSYFVLQRNNPVKINQAEFLIPELENLINEVDGIEISKNDQGIHLSKENGIWRIAEVDSYMADTNKIASLLLSLRNFTLKEKKTNNPVNYHKLSLAESGADAATVIKLTNASSKFADISIGKSAQRSQGTYVRKNNDSQSWLSDGSLDVDMDANAWIVADILDIDSNRIKSVSFSPTETESFTLNKLTPDDQAFVLQNISEGQKLKADTDINRLASGLQKLSIESAFKKPESIDAEKTNSIVYQLFSGMTYQLDLYKKDEQNLLSIQLRNANDESQFDQQLQNWLFIIPGYKFDALNKNKAEFIEALVEPTIKTDDIVVEQ